MTNPAGYTGAHAARFGQPQGGSAPKPASKPATVAPVAAKGAKPKETTVENASGREKSKGPQGGSVFDRMTDTSGYTGAHA